MHQPVHLDVPGVDKPQERTIGEGNPFDSTLNNPLTIQVHELIDSINKKTQSKADSDT